MHAAWSLLVVCSMLSGCSGGPAETDAGDVESGPASAAWSRNVLLAAGEDVMAALNINGTLVEAPGFYIDVTVPKGAVNATLQLTRTPAAPMPDGLRFTLGDCGWVYVPTPEEAAYAHKSSIVLCPEPVTGRQHLSYTANGAAQFHFTLTADVPVTL